MSIAEKFEVIADAVYEKGEIIGYENGRNEGLEEGYADGIANGREQELSAFWDTYQRNGASTSYAYAFYSSRWRDKIYNPKYDIIANNSNSVFNQSYVTDTLVDIDITAAGGNTSGMFQYSKLEKIRKLIVNENTGYSNCFTSCTKLNEINFAGTIGRSISFADCPLSVKSMKNVIEHLKDYSGDETNRGKYTLTFSDTCWGNLEASGTASDGDTWKNYVIKRGWLIG